MCPFVDKADSRCAEHMRFGNIFSAFAHCADGFTCCRTFREIAREVGYDKRLPHQETGSLVLAS